MTNTEKKVISHMKSYPDQIYWGLELMPIIFSNETIDRYRYSRGNSVVINKMTYLYLGKMAKKGLIKWTPEGYACNGNS